MDLVTVRFTSCRATLTTAHYSGVEYGVLPSFAKQVVEVERCAEYVETPPASTDAGGLFMPASSGVVSRASRKKT